MYSIVNTQSAMSIYCLTVYHSARILPCGNGRGVFILTVRPVMMTTSSLGDRRVYLLYSIMGALLYMRLIFLIRMPIHAFDYIVLSL